MAIPSVEPTWTTAERDRLRLRALALPTVIVAVGFVVSLVWAHFETYEPGNSSAAGAVGLSMLLGPLVGIATTASGAWHRPLSSNERAGLLAMSLGGAAVALFIVGPIALLIALSVACDGNEGCLS